MLARRQDGRRVLVLLLAAAGCCLARPQFEPGSTGSAKWERSSSPSTSPPATGSTIQAPDSSASLSGQPYSDKFHHRDEKVSDYRNGSKKQGSGDADTISESPDASEKIKEAEVPRSSRNSTAAQLGESIQTMATQLLSSHLLDDGSMVEADIRTPPKIKSQLERKHKQGGSGQGVAVPVIIEDGEDVEKTIEKLDRGGSSRVPDTVVVSKTSQVHAASRPQSTTPSSGFSTWILLSGSNTTNRPTVTKKTKPALLATEKPTTTRHEPNKPPPLLAFHNKPSALSGWTSTMTPSVTRPSTSFTRVVTSNPPPRKTSTAGPFSTTGSHVDNHANTTTAKPLPPTLTRKPNPAPGNKIKNQTRLDALTQVTRRKPATTSTTTNRPQVTSLSFKEVPVTFSPTPIENSTSSVSEDDAATSTTKRTRRPGASEKKKKKKNKNRHRRPIKKPNDDPELESKITDEDVNTSIAASTKERPLSTRIYNYLAREVMPSVGVGLLGLVFTAGLAGLIMYPFAGGAARKTYDETSPGGYYSYSSNIDREGGMSDAEAFGKVLAGMKEDQMSVYNNVGGGTSAFVNPQETRYDVTTSRYGGGSVDSSQEGAYGHSETSQVFAGSQSSENLNHGEDYARNQYSSPFPVYSSRGVRYRQVGIGTSYAVNHEVPETKEVTLTDKINHVALENESLFARDKVPSVQRGPVQHPTVEHGPRSLSRRRREALPEKDDMENEIIPSMVIDNNKKDMANSTPASTIVKNEISTESSSTVLPTEKPENTTSAETNEGSTLGQSEKQNETNVETTTYAETSEETTFIPTTDLYEGGNVFSSGIVTEENGVDYNPENTKPQPFSLLGLLKQLVQFKIRLGLDLLRNSSAAFTQYLEGVQKRMDASYRNNVKRSANIQEIRSRTNLRKTLSRNV
ncbi:uncharacterized protein LOC134528270 [Bacillus rossius redtenbacheri]|uniref:uncharacterized protein LOC134528270 n=1 Tax=Bacillus rossius redtenbacheri TaxID=93214 RepID=UPI002FDCE131